MKLMCRMFGHKIKYANAKGISPKLMKVIERRVTYCERKGCNYRIQVDKPIRDVDIKNGVNLWGSGGVCMGCLNNETCGSSSRNQPFMRIHCSIQNFAFANKSDASELERWGDTIID